MDASTRDSSALSRWLGAPLAALEFYTRIPRPPGVSFRPEHARRAAAFAPLVGWLVGGACALSYALAALVLPVEVAVLLAIAAGVWVTGALHEDGFADVCDAFGGGTSRAETLRILKDPRCGAYAVVGLVLLLLLKLAAIAAVAKASGTPAVAVMLVAAHALSRFAAVSAMHAKRYVSAEQESARSGDFARSPSARDLAFAAVFGLAPLLAFAALGIGWAVWCVLPALLARAYLVRRFERRIGGYTGDCLGAVQQVVEVLVYLSVCASTVLA